MWILRHLTNVIFFLKRLNWLNLLTKMFFNNVDKVFIIELMQNCNVFHAGVSITSWIWACLVSHFSSPLMKKMIHKTEKKHSYQSLPHSVTMFNFYNSMILILTVTPCVSNHINNNNNRHMLQLTIRTSIV